MIRGAVKLEGSQAAARARMISALARLTIASNPRLQSVRNALRTVTFGPLPAPDRAWAARIETRRTAALADRAPTGPPFDPSASSAADVRTTVGVATAMMSLSPRWCLLLLRLVRELKPLRCLELGAGFGISAAYGAAALELNGAGKLTTMEGSAEWATIARENLEALGLDRVEIRVGPIEAGLESTISVRGPFDFVFIDAEHQAAATLAHVASLLDGLAPGAVIVLDDVDWSEMRRALDRVAAHPRVERSVVVGRLGLVFLDGRPS